MASQLPSRPIIAKTGQRHKNSRPMSRGRSSVREVNPIAAIAKTDYFRSQEMMEAVREFPCGHTGEYHEGTCGAHPNWSWAAKAKSIKGHDLVAAMSPQAHYELDQGKNLTGEQREMMWLRAFYQTMLHGFRSGKFRVVK